MQQNRFKEIFALKNTIAWKILMDTVEKYIYS